VSDPLVGTAKPLLDAMKATFASPSARQDQLALDSATALAYPRRIEIVQQLLIAPAAASVLSRNLRIPHISLTRHLKVLRDLDLARNVHGTWHFTPNQHPLTRCLVHLLRQEAGPPAT
jgi:hypothetical protein